MHGFELVIGDDDVDSEPACDVRGNNSLEMFDDVAVLHGVELPS